VVLSLLNLFPVSSVLIDCSIRVCNTIRVFNTQWIIFKVENFITQAKFDFDSMCKSLPQVLYFPYGTSVGSGLSDMEDVQLEEFTRHTETHGRVMK